MKRFFSVLALMAVMAAMMVATAAPAFAGSGGSDDFCTPNGTRCGAAGGGNDAAGSQTIPGGGTAFTITNPQPGDREQQVLAQGNGGGGTGGVTGGEACFPGSNTLCRGSLGVHGNP